MEKRRKIANTILKIAGTVFVIPVTIVFILMVLLYVPFVQKFAIDKCSEIVSNSTGYGLSLGHFHLYFPLNVTIEDYALYEAEDTLLKGERLRVNLRFLSLLKGEIEANYITIENTSVDTYEMLDGMNIQGEVGYFRSVIRSARLTEKSINVNQFNLGDTRIRLTMYEKSETEDSVVSQSDNWSIALKKGKLENLEFEIKIPQDTFLLKTHIDETVIRNAVMNMNENSYMLDRFSMNVGMLEYDSGMEPDSVSPIRHLHFNDIGIDLNEVSYSKGNLGAELNRFVMTQPDGLCIDEGRFSISGDSVGFKLKNLFFHSKNQTVLKGNAIVPYSFIRGENGEEQMHCGLEMRFNKRDMRKFLTESAYGMMKGISDSLLYVNAMMHGNMYAMYIDTAFVKLENLAELDVAGYVKELTDENKRNFDITFNSKLKDLQKLFDSGNLPDSIKKHMMSVNGQISLYKKEYSINAVAENGTGIAKIQGFFAVPDNGYEAKVSIDKFGISDIIPEIPLHELTMSMELKGKGTDLYDNKTYYECNLHIDTLNYDKHQLEQVNLNVRQSNAISEINMKSDNRLLQMNLSSETEIMRSAITNRTDIKIEKADLFLLGLTDNVFQVMMNMNIEMTTDLENKYAIRTEGNDFIFTTNTGIYKPDRLNLSAATDSDTTFIKLTTGDLFFDAYMASGYKNILRNVTRISDFVAEDIENKDTLINIEKYEKFFPETKLYVSGKTENMLADFLSANGIKFKKFEINCNYDSLKGVNARGAVYHLEREKQHLDTIRFAVVQDSSRIKYFAGIRSSATERTQNMEKATFSAALFGSLFRNRLTADYIFRDKRDEIGMRIGLAAEMRSNGFYFNFNPDAILFRIPFTFNKDNGILLGNDMSLRGNIELRDTLDSGLNLYAASDSLNKQDVTLEVYNINLKTVTRILPFVPNLAGTLNIDMHYRDSRQGILFSSDIRSDELVYEGTLIGNETAEFSYFPRNKNEHYTYLTWLHNDEKVAHLEGIYSNDTINPKDQGSLTLTHFPLAIANAFIKDNGITTDGYLDGELSLSRNNKKPVANGYLRFDSVYADMPKFGTRLHLVDDKIEMKDNIAEFKNFGIYAKGSTPFKVNGTIDFGTLANPIFNLRMRANDYELVNARKTKGSILYGRMFVNLNSRITGGMNSLKMTGSLSVLGKTDITYILQDTPLDSENELDGLVTFTNFNDTVKIEPEIQEYDLGNMNMNLTINVEEGARINADFDENRTSYIELQGEGNLNMTYSDETGMNLTGRYILSNGQMKYTLPIIPLKTFNISEGSYINWTGDMMNPILDITAVERITSSVTLDDNSQAVAFDVGVKLSNTLDNIGLAFTLSAPENAAVQNQLNSLDAETLNKYALTMLITGAYIGGDNGLTVSSALSAFLDAQINNFVGNAMSNTVNINVGITDVEDSNTGDTYKNYSFSFTKRFWNDRLKVIIGGEVNNNENANANESFINNVSLEWKISNSGNRYLRIFYDKNYESILEGEIIETGIGYVYKRKLNNLNELFMFKKKNNADRVVPVRMQTIPTEEQKTADDRNKTNKEQGQ